MKTAKQRIDAIRDHGYDLDFSAAFNHAFETYKKIALLGGVGVLLFTIVIAMVVAGLSVFVFGISSLSESMIGFNVNNLSIGSLSLYILGTAILGGLSAPFTAGLIAMARNADIGEEITLGTVFEYYGGRYFGDLFLSIFLITLISTGINTLIEVTTGYPLIGLVPSVIIGLLTLLTIPLIIFGNLRAIDAIGASIQVVAKSFLMIAALMIIAYIMACIGVIAFCIGVFFTIPILYSMYYSIYVHSVGIEDESEINEIGSDWNS
jgi:hypothetical protein